MFTYIHGAFPLAPLWPLLAPLSSPLYIPAPLTWLPPDVTGIVHLHLRLLVNWPHLLPFTQLTHPAQISRTPPPPRLATTTSGLFWLLVSRTIIIAVSYNSNCLLLYLKYSVNVSFVSTAEYYRAVGLMRRHLRMNQVNFMHYTDYMTTRTFNKSIYLTVYTGHFHRITRWAFWHAPTSASGGGSIDLRVDRYTKLFWLIHSFYWVVNWNKIIYMNLTDNVC